MARKSRRKKLLEKEKINVEAVHIPETVVKEEALRTAAYARLSVDSGDEDKIETQVALLHNYIESQPQLELTDTYVDNGYTGTNFNRPEFNRLMEDVKSGRIHCIVVKDLSRFGRNFMETGYYLETVFPNLNVRFISINDDFDSSREKDMGNIAVPIKNIVNEFYAKEVSKKATLAFEISSQRGGRKIGRGTYGYTVDRENNKLVVNPETAPYVQIIFAWFLMGYSTVQIAKRLAMLQVGTPFYYRAIEEGKNIPETDHWSHDKVCEILRNQTYAGDTVYGKKRKMLYKNVDAYHAKQEDWIIHKDTHSALVSREDFEKVQEILDLTSQKRIEGREALKTQREKFTDYFPRKVCCMECGLTMTYTRDFRKQQRKEFSCAYYYCKGNGFQKDCKQKVKEDYLRMIVMDQIRNLVQYACDRKNLLKRTQSGAHSPEKLKTLRRKENDLAKELSHTLEIRNSLYENLREEVIDMEEYRTLKEQYILKEQALRKEIADVEEEKRTVEKKIGRCLEFADNLEKYLNVDGADKKIFAELIEKIIVSPAGKIEIRFTCADVLKDMAELTDETEG